MIGLIGKKIGMSRFFEKTGNSIPVTTIKIENHYVTQIKNLDKDGYDAIQITTGSKKNSHIKKSQIGHFSKSGIKVGEGLWEFRIKKSEKFYLGQEITIKFLKNFKKFDVTSNSKGKGFSGTVKRWNFHTQDFSHGNSLSHRAPGSIGQNQTPGRVFKGKKMSGQLGNKKITIQNLSVISIDEKNNLLIIKGSIPGFIGSNVIVKPSIKNVCWGKNGNNNNRY